MIITENERMLLINREAIPFSLERGKPNRIRISFTPENTLKIETGNGKLGKYEKDFLLSKSPWILKSYQYKQTENSRKTNFIEAIDREVLLLGKTTPVEYHPAAKTYFRSKKEGPFKVFAPTNYIEKHKKKLLYHALRAFSEHYLNDKVKTLAETCEIDFNRLRIKDLKSKWGSCSSLQNINLNWQLIFLEETLIDYVIIHELMHLREMNHSARFWNWVAKYYPEHKAARKKLKDKQWLIGILK